VSRSTLIDRVRDQPLAKQSLGNFGKAHRPSRTRAHCADHIFRAATVAFDHERALIRHRSCRKEAPEIAPPIDVELLHRNGRVDRTVEHLNSERFVRLPIRRYHPTVSRIQQFRHSIDGPMPIRQALAATAMPDNSRAGKSPRFSAFWHPSAQRQTPVWDSCEPIPP